MTTKERTLLRRIAEAYAFISDLRQAGIEDGDLRIIKGTKGIETRIEEISRLYPSLFKRYYNAAKKQAAKKG